MPVNQSRDYLTTTPPGKCNLAGFVFSLFDLLAWFASLNLSFFGEPLRRRRRRRLVQYVTSPTTELHSCVLYHGHTYAYTLPRRALMLSVIRVALTDGLTHFQNHRSLEKEEKKRREEKSNKLVLTQKLARRGCVDVRPA